MSNKYLIGFDIGGTKIGIGLGTVDGVIVQSDRIDNKNTDPAVVLPRLAAIAKELMAKENITGKDVLAFGISTPSPADIPNGIITTPPNNPYWRNVPIKSYLEMLCRSGAVLKMMPTAELWQSGSSELAKAARI